MKKFFIVFFAYVLLLTPGLLSMDWPSPTGQISRNFGWNESGKPHLGISFDDNGKISAVDNGELLFFHRQGGTASRLPSPLGSWIALDHGDGIISIYSRLDDESLNGNLPGLLSAPDRIERGQALAEAGISGWSSRNGFYFQLFDRKERRWINPFLILTPPVDTRPPTIQSVRLRNQAGNYFNPQVTRNLNQGRYVIVVDVFDTMRFANERPLAPYRISASVNGREVAVLNFETFSARNGSLMVNRNGLVPARQVYASFPAFELADLWFSRGQTTLEIAARDISGNARNMVFRFMVE